MKILSFGSLNIDYVYSVPHFVKKGETLSAKELNVYTGGKGLNQSIALARAGVETYQAGAIGTDGMFLLEQLKEAGVKTDLVKILDDVRTGNAIIMTMKVIIVSFYLEEQIRRSQKNRLMKSLKILQTKIIY